MCDPLSRSADGAAEGRAVPSPSVSPDVRLSDEQGEGIVKDTAPPVPACGALPDDHLQQLLTLAKHDVVDMYGGDVADLVRELLSSRAALERVRALCDEAEQHSGPGIPLVYAEHLRTALRASRPSAGAPR